MSVSSHSVNPEDDNEVHDLVLLFQNSRIPRGSDAFQSIMGDFLPSDEEEDGSGPDAFDEVDSGPAALQQDMSGVCNDSDNKSKPSSETKTTMRSKSIARVHFPDDDGEAQIIPQRRHSEIPRHHPRIFVKTTPNKPILKHDQIDITNSPQRLQPT